MTEEKKQERMSFLLALVVFSLSSVVMSSLFNLMFEWWVFSTGTGAVFATTMATHFIKLDVFLKKLWKWVF